MEPDPLDLCSCGDYRRDHGDIGCRLCVRGVHPWDYCARFTLWMAAEEAREWFEEMGRR